MNNFRFATIASILCLFGFTACSSPKSGGNSSPEYEQLSTTVAALPDDESSAGNAKAVFASGCFWCTEAVFERVQGVHEVISGYAGGEQANPTYKQVSEGRSDQAEAVIVYYDSTVVSYPQLLDIFFHSHDPTTLNRQGPDVGKQYRSGIYYSSAYQERSASTYKEELTKKKDFPNPIVTEIKALNKFWPAETYHQDYYKLNPDNPYIQSVSRPKVEKFEKEYQHYLKKEFKKNYVN